uniref:Nonstructural protein n=1 Tax=Parvoviridae sp. TaxID=1940570 RepID=A0A7D3UKQ1_9VIRU|nr:MAG: nonstructural protein [Parvoviridae sp.]
MSDNTFNLRCPTKGGYSAVFMLPTHLSLKRSSTSALEEIPLREAILDNCYEDPLTKERSTSGWEPKPDLVKRVTDFNPELETPDRWALLHLSALEEALEIESKIHPQSRIFCQMETTEKGRYHVHVLFVSGYGSRAMSWACKRLRRDILCYLLAITNGLMPSLPSGQIWAALNNSGAAWLSLNRVYHPGIGKTIPQQCNPDNFMRSYFFTKRHDQVIYRWANANMRATGLLTRCVNEPYTLDAANEEAETPVAAILPGNTLPITFVSTVSSMADVTPINQLKITTMEILVMEALRLCKETFCFTMQDFMLQHADKYLQFASRQGGLKKLESTLELYRQTLVGTSTAWQICKAMYGDVDTDDMTDNMAYRLCLYQGYSPQYMSHTICCWLDKNLGKKNTLWFYGPANTGKTMMAESICKMVKLYGNVNHNNANFPFNDCHGKAVCWWEECVMTDAYVEAAKCILGGSSVRVDRKGEDSVLVTKTPVVITSNNDITQCLSRNSTTQVHAAPLRARTLKFTFNTWLTNNWGLITPEHMYQFLSWGEQQGPVTLTGWIALNPSFDGVVPFNQPKGAVCDTCSFQVNPGDRLTICNTCGAWQTAPVEQEHRTSEPAWAGTSEQDLYSALGEGKEQSTIPGNPGPLTHISRPLLLVFPYRGGCVSRRRRRVQKAVDRQTSQTGPWKRR